MAHPLPGPPQLHGLLSPTHQRALLWAADPCLHPLPKRHPQQLLQVRHGQKLHCLWNLSVISDLSNMSLALERIGLGQ